MRFSDVLDIRNGRNQRQVENENGKYPIYGSGGIIGHADNFICDAETVVIGRKGSINNPIFVDEPFWNVDTAFGLVANKEVLLPKYLYYFCVNYNFEQLNTTVTIPSLTKANLLQIEIRVPDMDIQQNIVNVLDKICYLNDVCRKELYSLDQLVKSRFIEMFGDMKLNKRGWKLKSFEELTYLITDGEHATPKRTDKGIYLLSARNILNHSLQLKDVDYINEKEYDRIAKRIIPQEGDILISCSGTVGRCCSVPSGFHFQMVRSVALIRFKEYINPIFAEYMITSDYLQEQINSSKTVSSQANLFQGKIRTLKGFVPPIELQNQFADFVAQTDKSKYYNFTSYKYCVLVAKLIRQEWMLCQTLSF